MQAHAPKPVKVGIDACGLHRSILVSEQMTVTLRGLPLSGDVIKLEIVPQPEGVTATFQETPSSNPPTYPIERVREYIPDPLPEPLNQPGGCDTGATLGDPKRRLAVRLRPMRPPSVYRSALGGHGLCREQWQVLSRVRPGR